MGEEQNQSTQPAPAGGTTQVNALQSRVGKPVRLTWTALQGARIVISSDKALDATAALNAERIATGDKEFMDVTPTLTGDFTITITAYDSAGANVLQKIEDDLTVLPPLTQLLPPWKAGDPVTGPSSFHIVTQCIPGQNVHGSSDPNNKVISKNGSDQFGNFSWTDNGCGPASAAGTLRWSLEQNLISDEKLSAVVNGKSGDMANAYMKLLFPNLNGQVPCTKASDCDVGAVYDSIKKMYGLQHTEVYAGNPDALAALLKVAPVICVWSTPSHFSTAHGIVTGSDGKTNVWIADPGDCLAAGTKSSFWKSINPPTNIGTPSGVTASVGGPSVYISVPWDFFKAHLSSACQLLKV